MSAYEQELGRWAGPMGDAYFAHPMNAWTERSKKARERFWLQMLQRLPSARSIFEVGCGDGPNLFAIGREGGCALEGVEPNEKARARAAAIPWVRATYTRMWAAAPASGNPSFDLVFTWAALITIPDDGLPQMLQDIAAASQRFVLLVEYYQPQPIRYEIQEVGWRFWARDYGALALQHCPDLKPLDAGFLWAETAHLDNLTWWLLEKKA